MPRRRAGNIYVMVSIMLDASILIPRRTFYVAILQNSSAVDYAGRSVHGTIYLASSNHALLFGANSV